MLITWQILPNPFLYVMSVASSEANHFRIVLSFCLVSVVSKFCLHFCARSCSLAKNNCSQPNLGSISTVDIDMRGIYKHKIRNCLGGRNTIYKCGHALVRKPTCISHVLNKSVQNINRHEKIFVCIWF